MQTSRLKIRGAAEFFLTSLSVLRNHRMNTFECVWTCFSNSLIIHKIKTKEINTEMEFGYVMKHLHKIKPTFISIFPLNILICLRCYIKHSGECFIRISKRLEVVKKLGLRPRFSTHFSGFGYPDETLFLVFDILLLKLIDILGVNFD